MSRDYAKKSDSRSRNSKKSSGSKWLLFIIILIIIGLAAGFVYLHKNKWLQTPKTVAAVQKTTKNSNNKIQQPIITAPRFEFYDMLSGKNTVGIAPTTTPNTKPNTSITTAGQTREIPVVTPKPTTAVKPNGYIVQIASFQDSKPAEQLKASLLLQGIDASMLKLSYQGKTWYRVVAGAYKDSAAAEKVKAKLTALGYKPIIHNQTTL